MCVNPTKNSYAVIKHILLHFLNDVRNYCATRLLYPAVSILARLLKV